MDSDRALLRVSDAERQAAAERLRAGLADGRLDLLEYDNRLALAYQAVTYADLDQLFTDLPTHGAAPAVPVTAPRPVPSPPSSRPVDVRTGFAGLPLALRILWTVWSGVVLINLTVWLLVSVGTPGPDYFWPMWLAVPGVALFGVSAAITAGRSAR
jgi:hypothetical protein